MSTEKTKASEKTNSRIIDSEQRWEPASVDRIPVMQQLSGAALGRVTLLDTQAPLTVGRDAGCQLVVNDDTCSRRHAEIRVSISPDGVPVVMVRDLKSSNGTRIQDDPLQPDQEHAWHAGQTLEIGIKVRFQLSLMRRDDAEALEWVSRSSHRDRATGLLTRRGLLEALERETQHLARHPQESIAVVLLRIFDFADEGVAKKADAALRFWVEKLLPRIRSGTILGRTSEFEVVAILRHCDIEGARAAMKRYHEAIEAGRSQLQTEGLHTEPAIGGALVTGKYNPDAEAVLHFAETEIFKFGHPGTEHKLVEYVRQTAATSKRR